MFIEIFCSEFVAESFIGVIRKSNEYGSAGAKKHSDMSTQDFSGLIYTEILISKVKLEILSQIHARFSASN